MVAPSLPRKGPSRRFGNHLRRGMPTYIIGLCLTPSTPHTGIAFNRPFEATRDTSLRSLNPAMHPPLPPPADSCALAHCDSSTRIQCIAIDYAILPTYFGVSLAVRLSVPDGSRAFSQAPLQYQAVRRG